MLIKAISHLELDIVEDSLQAMGFIAEEKVLSDKRCFVGGEISMNVNIRCRSRHLLWGWEKLIERDSMIIKGHQ